MGKNYTILSKDSTHKGLLLEVLADDAAGFEALKADHPGQLSPGTVVDVVEEQTAYRLLNSGEWGTYKSYGGGSAWCLYSHLLC